LSNIFRSIRNFAIGLVLIEDVRANAAHQIKPTNKPMKTNTIIVIAAAIGLAGAAHAEKPGEDRPHRPIPPEIIAKFDKDGDGKLNKEEREAAKAAREEMMEARKKEMLAKFDKDGDGKLSDEEEEAMREARRKMMLEKFDKDGDGELSDDEKAAMRKAMGDRPGGPRKGDGKRRPDDGKRRPEGGDRKRPEAQGDKEAPGAGE
jgi:hypothetical protein